MTKMLLAVVVALASMTALMTPAAGLVEPPASVVNPANVVERYLPRSPGVEKDMTFYFGPFNIPPGQDINRITVDLPLHNGFVVAIAPNLVDAVTGEEPSDLDVHIHHAHWFRVSNDPNEEYYTLNLAWVFGTGEEKTQGSFNDRSAAEAGGPRYGIYIPGGQPQALIFMIHNKGTQPINSYIVLDTRFVYGTQDEIASAANCGPVLLEGEVCSAGDAFHAVSGKLWGQTFDVPRQADGDGIWVQPADRGQPNGIQFTAWADGTAIATAGHLHPNGREVLIANLGPAGSGCEADVDGDGFPGVTLLHSRKLEREPRAFPYSEDYQMAASKFGWRAPVREGDRITQFGVYANQHFASYEAMSYTGIYVDRQQLPGPATGDCLADLAPRIVGSEAGPANEGILNHNWGHHAEPLCNLFGNLPEMPACDLPEVGRPPSAEVPAVAIGAFAYLPGDMKLSGQLGAPAQVVRGQPLRFVNADVAAAIRHTVTSCDWPCNGPYVANYPQPNGLFDSGKLGNLDYIDGGITGDDTQPTWDLDTAELEPGMYSYYCRIHPTMRGILEVVNA